ncbi:MAG: hypothetical protein DWQ07_25225 [Chloroflexi bacterium]|nr:MAG: hypothetical protein DWQ07_25225 [Chloroflexota bacterium]MBL1196162.1 hypothetical protein [Chloroflexota bacterium]NOH13455.1 hypothetical protein [Chloroflexota bacterium]
MSISRFPAKLIPLLTITLLLFNLLAPVSIAFAQDADPPPAPPPSEEVVVEDQPVEEAPAEEEAAVEEENVEAPAEPEKPGDETDEEPTEEEAQVEEEAEASDEPETDGEPLEEEPTSEEEPADGEEASQAQEEQTEANAPEAEGEAATPEEDNPVAEAVEALDEADAVLLDEEGEALAMATQEAAEALAAPDPQFCPAGLSFGDVGCGASHANMADAIADALTAAASGISGTIFVESGNFDYSGINDVILLDGFNNNTSLTIQGNADGGGTTTFTTAFLVGANANNIFSSLTFNDVTFDAGVVVTGTTGDLSFNDVIANADGGADAISVSNHDGAVSLDHVTANNTFSASDGADIDNAVTGSNASVTVTNSTFNGFVNNGLLVNSDGEINISNVTANGNGESGLDLNNSTSSTEADITLDGVTANNNQQGAGLQITSFGDITLDNVTANGNLDNGAVLSNPGGSEPNSIQVSNSNFNNNGTNGTYTGLEINTTGSITLNGVSANDNTGNGAQLFNLGSSNNAAVNVFNSNFNGNGLAAINSAGLSIQSKGAITLDGVSASDNVGSSGAYGANLGNPLGNPAPVTITNSIFNNNVGRTSFGTGLSVFSGGQISLNGVQANLNGSAGGQGTGASINATAGPPVDVSISNSNFDGNFGDSNITTGLLVSTGGTITLDTVTASGNTSTSGTTYGTLLSNTFGPDNDQQVNVSNSSFDNNTGSSDGTGLYISSYGNVNLWGVSASGNSTYGVFISILSGPNDVSIICSAIQNNGDTGIFVGGGGGDLTILSTDTSGNGVSPLTTVIVANTTIGTTNCNPGPGDDKPRDGKHVPLDPKDPTTIVLDLYPHSVTFPPMNLLECEGFVRSLFFASELPGELNEGDTFLRALKMHIEGCEIPEGGMFTIGFDIPATEQDNEFAVLVWDGSTESWVEVPGQMTEDGRYTVTWPTTGIFVLVTR